MIYLIRVRYPEGLGISTDIVHALQRPEHLPLTIAVGDGRGGARFTTVEARDRALDALRQMPLADRCDITTTEVQE
jgi:hypothetical protein